MENLIKHIRVSPINKHSVLKEVRTNGSWEGYIAPNDVSRYHVANGWHIGIEIKIMVSQEPETLGEYFVETRDGDFGLDKFLKSYSFYNCNSELGQRIRFWEVSK